MYPETYEPPARLNEDGRDFWRRVVPVLDGRGHWMPIDRAGFDIVCVLWSTYMRLLRETAQATADAEHQTARVLGEIAEDEVLRLGSWLRMWLLAPEDAALVAGTSDPSRPEYLAAQRALRAPDPPEDEGDESG